MRLAMHLHFGLLEDQQMKWACTHVVDREIQQVVAVGLKWKMSKQ
jgi:hypothetical protein